MQKLDFAEAVSILADAEPRYHPDAYFFLREALDHTVKLRKRQLGESGHVTGAQLCDGIRNLALQSFGPMVPTVFEYWGIRKTDDFGEMVWKLIELGVFGKTDADSKDDFNAVFSFHDAFVAPYVVASVVPGERRTKPRTEVRN